jgi:hypothetical protein
MLAIIAYREIEERLNAKERKFLWMRRLHWFALSLFKLYILEKSWMSSRCSALDPFFRMSSTLLERSAARIDSAHYDAVERDKTAVFALVRSDTRWSAMREKFQTFLKQSLSALPLTGFCSCVLNQ